MSHEIKIGDTVTRGYGKKQYVVTKLFRFVADGPEYAALKPLTGYTNASTPVENLHKIQEDA